MNKFGSGVTFLGIMIAVLCLVLMFYGILRLSSLTRQESGAVFVRETVIA